eukprot:4730577-Amphidinium_carterae.1
MEQTSKTCPQKLRTPTTEQNNWQIHVAQAQSDETITKRDHQHYQCNVQSDFGTAVIHIKCNCEIIAKSIWCFFRRAYKYAPTTHSPDKRNHPKVHQAKGQ